MQILKTKFTIIEVEKELMTVIRTVPSNLPDKNYKLDIKLWLEALLKYKPKFCFIDCSNYFFPITPELQVWVDESLLTTAVNTGLQYIAFLMGKDVFAKMSIKQTMKEKSGKKLKTKYFNDKDKAMVWLISKM